MNPDSENEWIGVAVFDSKEAHLANANTPKQHEMFLQMMDILSQSQLGLMVNMLLVRLYKK